MFYFVDFIEYIFVEITKLINYILKKKKIIIPVSVIALYKY